MVQYRFAVGTHDPLVVEGGSDSDAVRVAVALVHRRFGDDLRDNPQEVATLLGPSGLVTRPSERLDEFVQRMRPYGGEGPIQPGDTTAPDCNGD